MHLQLLRRCLKGHGSDQLSVDALCTAVTMPLCSFGQACTCRHKYHLQPAVPCRASATATNKHLRQAYPRKNASSRPAALALTHHKTGAWCMQDSSELAANHISSPAGGCSCSSCSPAPSSATAWLCSAGSSPQCICHRHVTGTTHGAPAGSTSCM